ncbi:hypothetical protein FPQ18DRAFT_419162 [Pyronema domesticum]|nr:hypothetical protein FPQ18DRAFT_419162 [Pyronema domesticum]
MKFTTPLLPATLAALLLPTGIAAQARTPGVVSTYIHPLPEPGESGEPLKPREIAIHKLPDPPLLRNDLTTLHSNAPFSVAGGPLTSSEASTRRHASAVILRSLRFELTPEPRCTPTPGNPGKPQSRTVTHLNRFTTGIRTALSQYHLRII